MPELPDVETFKRYFEDKALNQTVTRVDILDDYILEGVSPAEVKSRLEGRQFRSASRYGKYLLAQVAGDGLLVLHFGMTGTLQYFDASQAPPPYSRVIFNFGGGHSLAYTLARRLGRLRLASDAQSFIAQQKLGPDALAITADEFRSVIRNTRRPIKSALMDQERIAGVGNIYSDEILFQARMHPLTSTEDLSERQADQLYAVMRAVLQQAVESKADPDRMPQDYLLHHLETDKKCPRCGGAITRLKIAGRSARYCPSCQSAAGVYAKAPG